MNQENNKLTVFCPCCEAILTIDRQTGAILTHEEKQKKIGSFDDMLKGLDKQKEARENIFAQELNQQKERSRLLDEKFREAVKRADADSDAKPFVNPLDLD